MYVLLNIFQFDEISGNVDQCMCGTIRLCQMHFSLESMNVFSCLFHVLHMCNM